MALWRNPGQRSPGWPFGKTQRLCSNLVVHLQNIRQIPIFFRIHEEYYNARVRTLAGIRLRVNELLEQSDPWSKLLWAYCLPCWKTMTIMLRCRLSLMRTWCCLVGSLTIIPQANHCCFFDNIEFDLGCHQAVHDGSDTYFATIQEDHARHQFPRSLGPRS